MVEMICILIVAFVLYLVAVFVVAKRTVEKLGAPSGRFGVGLVNIVTGFLLHDVIDMFTYAYYWNEEPSLLYLAFRFGLLILGISGIIMVAVDLLQTVRDMGGYISRVDEKLQKSTTTAEAAKQKEIPAWKRIQMDNE